MSKSYFFKAMNSLRMKGFNPMVEKLGLWLYNLGDKLAGNNTLKEQKNYVLYKEPNGSYIP